MVDTRKTARYGYRMADLISDLRRELKAGERVSARKAGRSYWLTDLELREGCLIGRYGQGKHVQLSVGDFLVADIEAPSWRTGR